MSRSHEILGHPEPGAIARRGGWLLALLLAAYALLALRLVDLQVYDHAPLAATSVEQQQDEVRWSPWRGSITDCNGRVLALSAPVRSCAIDPLFVARDGIGIESTVQLLAEALKLTPAEVQEVMERSQPRGSDADARPRRFVWVRRHLAEESYEAAQAAIAHEEERRKDAATPEQRPLRVAGVLFPKEYDRLYPNGQLAAHVLGFTDIDGTGREGVEQTADALLRGLGAKRPVRRDARRRALVRDGGQVEVDREGLTVELALDATIQRIAEEEIARCVAEFSPSAACAVVMNPYTGDVLAAANYPTFNPNEPAASPAANRFNQLAGSIMEPGSTFKPVVFAAALDAKAFQLEQIYDCEWGRWRMANGRILNDAHPYKLLTAEMVLVKSSNIGMAKIAAEIGPERLYRGVRAFGFGQETGLPMPGEQKGMLHPLNTWTSYSMGSIPMGQEVAVTPVQLAAAYCVLANGGTLLRPRIVMNLRDSEGALVETIPVQPLRQKIIRPETAAQVRAVLRKVVTEGTGRKLQMPEYEIGGKSGTAQLPVNEEERRAGHRGGYSPDRYVASFVGLAPYDVPRVVVSVMVREPKGEYYGGVVSGPVVKEISRRTLLYLGVPPQNAELAP